MILTIRTDNPNAELGLYDDDQQIDYVVWNAHRQLAETIYNQITTLLETNKISLSGLTGIICFQGPGSFTGLRIGITVANTLAYSLSVPIVATQDPTWIENGLKGLKQNQGQTMVLPFYGADVHITLPRK